MQQDAVDCAMQAMEKYNIEKDIAAYVKKEFDKKYNPTWHCIVGRNFGSYVTHETKHFIYFYLDMPTSWYTAFICQLLCANCNTTICDQCFSHVWKDDS
ncbi:Dynein light chain 2, cytoplasmic [Characodon lateralis]|uniref:Dynein light chain n=1 Tax=Characodon lateralis TaxID=208331 RepID=A0ABU7DHI2_9TELE|nr:Dynein light chain 2, cytoplasmic [Characodon lateralis]